MKSSLLSVLAPLAKGQQWFQQQSPGDQQRLRWLAGFLALLFLWVGVVNPVLSFRDRAAGALTQAQNDLAWLNSNYGALSAALAQRKQAAPQGDAALLRHIDLNQRLKTKRASRSVPYQGEINASLRGRVTKCLGDTISTHRYGSCILGNVDG